MIKDGEKEEKVEDGEMLSVGGMGCELRVGDLAAGGRGRG